MSTIQRLYSGVTALGPFPYLRPQIAGIPSNYANAIYLLGDANVAAAFADAISGNPASAPAFGSPAGTVTNLSGGGALLAGRASLPQAAGTEINLSSGWTVWAAITIQPTTGAAVWPVLVDKLYESGHGFQIFAQSVATVTNGSQIALYVRMSVNGADVTSAQMQIPANGSWVFGQPFDLVVSHDGFGHITGSIWASNGLVSQATMTVSIIDGEGPTGNKVTAAGWRVGGIASGYSSPGLAVEAWGVSARPWLNQDAQIAYRTCRALGGARTRPWF